MSSNNYGGEPTPRDITPNGVSRHKRVTTDGSSSMAATHNIRLKEYASNPFQIKDGLMSKATNEDQCMF